LGHEFGYGYTHTSLSATSALTGGAPQDSGLAAHQGFYDFLAYALPEGSHVRPFACGGVQFTSFTPAGSYSRETKYGVNFGGGVKVKVMENWGFRLDARQYNMSKPFNSQLNSTGRLQLYEFSVGVSFMM
jgi:opacity protein-like surface antigen